ncbi:hypothetical protein [Calothrix rhizosoleniae]|uniref:hypothetical protein n=1 Tax=Calothrix rhizosoleniae TaxID=888997 RepID=UPI0011779AB7|nr:hypothetical protein [Calothrix rhizosoleniae]
MGETNASRLRRETPTGCASCFMPGNPSTASGLPSPTLAPQDCAALLDLSVEREKVFSLFKPLDLSMG